MIGIVVVGHGRLACEFMAATEHVVGPQRNFLAVCSDPDDILSVSQKEIDDAVDSVNEGDGVIIVTDMFGGTPCNLAIGSMRGPDIEVIYGANLPMLVKLAKCRSRPLTEAVEAALEAGRKYVDSASHMLRAGAG